jgi:O-antigen/teichoic acid export membrane protein
VAVSPMRPTVRGEAGTINRMARGSSLNLVGAVCNQSSLLLIMAVLALRLDKADVGRYAECWALLTLLGLLSLAGFRAALTRFVAMHLADDDAGRLRGTVRLGLSLTVVGSVLAGGVLALAAEDIADLFHDPSLRPALLLVALALPASTMEDAALAATQGWRSQRAYTLIGAIFDPVSRLLLTGVTVALGAGLIGALWSLVAAAWTGAALSLVALGRRMRTVPRATPTYAVREIFGFSMVSWGSALATTGLIWADTLLLGYLATQEDVGVYTVATRLVTLAVFVMAPINNSFIPHMAHLYHVGDRAGAERAFGAANRWIVRLSMPAFVMLLIFPADLLGFFGKGFATAATVTVILAAGQMVNAAVGPCGSVLNMSGHVRLSLVDNVAVLVGNVALNLWLIPQHGIVGAAVAWSLSLTLVNLVKVVQVRLVVGLRSLETGWGQTLAAGMAAALTGLVVAHYTHGWLAAVIAGGGCVLAVYAGVLLVLGLGTDDAALLRSVARRAGVPARLGLK